MQYALKSLIPNFLKKRLKIFYYKFTSNYLIKKPLASRKIYEELYQSEIKKKYQKIDNKININNQTNNFINNLAKITQITIKKEQNNFQHGKLIYYYLKNYLKSHNYSFYNLLETGTARGFSTIIMSKALVDCKKKGLVTSIDIIPGNVKIYWNCISDTINGKVTRIELLKNYKIFLKNINFYCGTSKSYFRHAVEKRIHFAFLDSSHDYEDVKLEYLKIKKNQKKK